jgi:hypothetical protein
MLISLGWRAAHRQNYRNVGSGESAAFISYIQAGAQMSAAPLAATGCALTGTVWRIALRS